VNKVNSASAYHFTARICDQNSDTCILRLQRMHEMHTVVTDDGSVCPSVCLSHGSTRLHCAKTVERIKIMFGVNTLGAQETCVRLGF